MSGIIECRTCSEPKCVGCNLFILSQMLHEGKLNALMDDHRTIIPAADVRPVVRGKWIIDRAFGNDVMSNEQMVICSACHKGIFWGKQKYCPNCGAEMEKEARG